MKKLLAIPAALAIAFMMTGAAPQSGHFAAIIATNDLPNSVVLEKQAELAAYLTPAQIDTVGWVPVSNTVTHIEAFATYEWVCEMERVKKYRALDGTNWVSLTSGAPVSQATVDDANEGMDPDLFITTLTNDFVGWLTERNWEITN